MANTTNFPAVEFEEYTYQWTGRKDDEGRWIVLVNGEELPVYTDETEDGVCCGYGDRKECKCVDNCKGLALDGCALFEGYKDGKFDDNASKVKIALTYPTLEEVYTKQDLFSIAIQRSYEYGEVPPRVASPDDIIMTLDAPIVFEGTKEYDNVVARFEAIKSSQEKERAKKEASLAPAEEPAPAEDNGVEVTVDVTLHFGKFDSKNDAERLTVRNTKVHSNQQSGFFYARFK